jgi:hypothetical protein
MTITLELPPDLEARFVAEAKATGVPVAEVVRGCLFHAFPRCNPQPPTVADIERAFEEAAGIIPEGIPALSDEAMSRESMYTREDGWNRYWTSWPIPTFSFAGFTGKSTTSPDSPRDEPGSQGRRSPLR